jgi:hypothetical protein
MRRLADLGLGEFWWAVDRPAPLAGMPYPLALDWRALDAHGFLVVVALHDGPPYDPDPLAVERFVLEDLQGGRHPTDPGHETELVLGAVACAHRHLAGGRGVAVHCAGGTGRSGTVVGGTLVSLGHDVDRVAGWLHAVHRARGSAAGWPESSWQREVLDVIAGRTERR